LGAEFCLFTDRDFFLGGNLFAYAEHLTELGEVEDAANAAKPAHERLTLIRVFEELRGLGYHVGYDAVRRYARSWHRKHAATSAALMAEVVWAEAPVAASAAAETPRANASRRVMLFVI
jgi:hypothetical protein